MIESFQRCKVCDIPDFMAVAFTRVSEAEGYCEDHVPKQHDPKEYARKLFNKFFTDKEPNQ
jgi:hypothetical protein